MTRRFTGALAATVLAGLLAGCGGGSDEAGQAATPSPTPSATPSTKNTVAGCQAAAIRAVLAGNLGDPDDGSGDYPECIGLTEAQLNKAAQGMVEDPAVKKAMAEIVDKGLPGVELSPGPLPTLPADPMADETPTTAP